MDNVFVTSTITVVAVVYVPYLEFSTKVASCMIVNYSFFTLKHFDKVLLYKNLTAHFNVFAKFGLP